MKRMRLVEPSVVRSNHRQMAVLFVVQVAVIALLVAFVSVP